MNKNFLFVSITGLISDIAWIVSKEGNNVKFYIADKEDRDIGMGFVERIDDWKAEVDWADVIVFDDVLGHGKLAEELRAQGKIVVGGTEYTDLLEDDRTFGQQELKKYGVSIIPYQNFTSFDDAIEFVKQNPSRYVIKPCGDAPKKLLFVGEEDNGQDIVQVLEGYKKTWANKIKLFQLQKRVTGVEVAIGAFFNGNEFLYPINVNFENKRMFPGNIGPSTGEMGTSMFWSASNKIFNATLKKLEIKLAEENFVGYIDINCIVNGNGIYPLEFTSRFGYPTIFIQQEGINMPMGEFFYRMANGENFTIKTKSGFQVGIRILMPPYPFDDEETFSTYSKDAAIIFKKPTQEGAHIEDVKLIDGQWTVAGSAGVVLTVVGTGPTMKQAQAQAYNRITNILIPNMYYRSDIGDRWYEDSDRLHNWGYLRDF